MVTEELDKLDEIEGLLEIGPKGRGFLRQANAHFSVRRNDPVIKREKIEKWALREGMYIQALAKPAKYGEMRVKEIIAINGEKVDNCWEIGHFDDFTVIDPLEMLHLETGARPLGTRVIDLLCPIGKGQRGLIVAPPRTGKTILLQQISQAIKTNYPDIHIMLLLIDERPEEVTDMRRNIPGEVLASSNDKDINSHVRIARLGMARAKRMVEFGKDVVVLLDSITRLGRAFNGWVRSSGRTMSGGVDIRALQLPKQIFGSARNIEGGGSLTIIATALIETGSRMDDVIFQEFKGTGNMELVLDRDLANRRVYPAINIAESGTRKEELLIDKHTLAKIQKLRKHLNDLPFGQDVSTLVHVLRKYKSNKQLLDSLP